MKRFYLFLLVACPTAFASGLLVADGGFGGQLEIVDQNVRVSLNQGVVVTHVEQVFRNQEDRMVEALYVFPVPRGASVANFSMWINGKEMIGEVLEKGRAREIYQSYKQTRRDPGLLEQKDFKTFEMRIFPIQPRAEQRIQITYYQELETDGNWATYVYPLATTSVPSSSSRVSGTFSFHFEGTSGIPIVALESPSHSDEIVFNSSNPHFFNASLEIPQGSLAQDIVVAMQAKRPKTGIDLITSKPSRDDGTFLLTLTTGDEIEGQTTGMDYVFVLDVSGSMNRDGKLDLSRNSVAAFIEALDPQDRFQVLRFNVNVESCFNSLMDGNENNKTSAKQYMAQIQPKGGTSLEPALQMAYTFQDPDRPLNVVLLSDGMTSSSESAELTRLIAGKPNGSKVFAIGVGNEVNRPLLSQLAEDAGGMASFISRGDNFKRQAQAFRRKLMKPVASNVRIRIEGVQTYDLEPPTLPNLFHGSPMRIYGRYSGGGQATVHVEADVGGQSLKTQTQIEFPNSGDSHPEIERMWAWHRIKRLEKQGGSSAVPEIVRLGETFSIVCKYSSFLVLENDQEYRRWRIERRNLQRIERDRKSHAQMQAKVRESMRELHKKVPQDLGPPETEVAKKQPRPNQPMGQRIEPTRRKSSGGDLDFGGGAIDPLLAIMVLAIGGWMWFKPRQA